MRDSPDPADSNFNRGYEHWLMTEAKRRNPDIELLGLVYAWPSWINPGAAAAAAAGGADRDEQGAEASSGGGPHPKGSSPYESNVTEQNAATYMAAWVSGVKRTHNLTIDWVGVSCDAFLSVLVCVVVSHAHPQPVLAVLASRHTNHARSLANCSVNVAAAYCCLLLLPARLPLTRAAVCYNAFCRCGTKVLTPNPISRYENASSAPFSSEK